MLTSSGYINKELAEYLLNKLVYSNVKFPATGEGRMGYLHIHMAKYNDKVLIFQNNYSRLLGIFQFNNLDLMDEVDFSLNMKRKIVEQLKKYGHIDEKQANQLISEIEK